MSDRAGHNKENIITENQLRVLKNALDIINPLLSSRGIPPLILSDAYSIQKQSFNTIYTLLVEQRTLQNHMHDQILSKSSTMKQTVHWRTQATNTEVQLVKAERKLSDTQILLKKLKAKYDSLEIEKIKGDKKSHEIFNNLKTLKDIREKERKRTKAELDSAKKKLNNRTRNKKINSKANNNGYTGNLKRKRFSKTVSNFPEIIITEKKRRKATPQ
ncbi:hypothetical protein DAMA08_001670 [Martiniozyma asiatica (nom. inval.)]|nr:hypothetical protein DAMA08_001670 [Martiniozyma asiatica]